MDSNRDSVADLKQKLQETNESVSEANNNVTNSQSAIKRLTALKASLERIVKEVDGSQSEIEKLRETASIEHQDSKKVLDGLFTKLSTELSEEQRGGINNAVKEVDDEIDALQKTVSDAQAKVAEAQHAEAQAKDEATTLEASLRETQVKLGQGLPAEIKAAQARVSKLKVDAKAAADGGRATEAFFLASELRKALDSLQGSIDPQEETGLVDRVAQQWHDLIAANDEVSTRTTDRERLQRELATAEQELKTKTQARQAAIKAKLSAIHAPATPPATPPTAPTTLTAYAKPTAATA